MFSEQCTDANLNNSSVTTGVLTRSMTRTKFSQLNDDCILEIFSYLSKRELMRIERGNHFKIPDALQK